EQTRASHRPNRYRPVVLVDELSSPPLAGFTPLFDGRIFVAIASHTDMCRRFIWKWVFGEQSTNVLVARKQPLDEAWEPFTVWTRRHRRKPQLPIEPEMIRCPLWWPPTRIRWLPLELVRSPFRFVSEFLVGRALDDEFVSPSGDRPERTVRIHEVQRVETPIHRLSRRHQILDWPVAQDGDDDHHAVDGDLKREADRYCRRGRDTRQRAEQRVVERTDRKNDRERVQPREVPAQHQPSLIDDRQNTRDRRDRLRGEVEKRYHEFDDVMNADARFVYPVGEFLEIPAQRIRHRLGFVVVEQTGEIAPARIPAELDQS